MTTNTQRRDFPMFANRRPEPAARRNDPATSHIAAASMLDAAKRQQRQLLAALRETGANGLTCSEADQMIGWRLTTASRRMPELVAMGLAADTGARRRTPQGRWATVWMAADSPPVASSNHDSRGQV
jgi:hypothetical protein